ncbi:hypothetical protein ACFLRG_00635 [Bacteroidota bacterium]
MITKFCHIGSLGSYSYLTQFSKIHLFLAPLALHDSAYSKYFSTKSNEGNYTILDTGALELSLGTEQVELRDQHFLEMACDLYANEIVCPDEPLNPQSSLRRSLSFVKGYKALKDYQKPNIMFVPQGTNIKEWLCNFEILYKEIPNGTVGIPRLLSEKYHSTEQNIRINISKILKKKFKNIQIHFLGAGRLFLHELELIKKSDGLIRSIDTSFLHRYAFSNQDPKTIYAKPVPMRNKLLPKDYRININNLHKIFLSDTYV